MILLTAILLLGVMASLSPSTIVVFILLLSTTRARVNAAAFMVGWCISLSVVFSVSYVVGGGTRSDHGARSVVEVIEILLGVALVTVAARVWQRRDLPPRDSESNRRLVARLRQLKPWEAAVVGIAKQPWALTAAAAVLVAHHHAALLVAVIAFVVFTVTSTATVGLIFLYYARQPGEADARLAILRVRVARAGPPIAAAVLLTVGVILIIDGARGLL